MPGAVEQAILWLERRRAQIDSIVLKSEVAVRAAQQSFAQQWGFVATTRGSGVIVCGGTFEIPLTVYMNGAWSFVHPTIGPNLALVYTDAGFNGNPGWQGTDTDGATYLLEGAAGPLTEQSSGYTATLIATVCNPWKLVYVESPNIHHFTITPDPV